MTGSGGATDLAARTRQKFAQVGPATVRRDRVATLLNKSLRAVDLPIDPDQVLQARPTNLTLGSARRGVGEAPPDPDQDLPIDPGDEREINAPLDTLLEDGLTIEQEAQQIALAIRNGHDPGHPDIDWRAVRSLSVYGGWSLDKIARECGIARAWVAAKSKEGKWIEDREEYRRGKEDRLRAKIARAEERLADEQATVLRSIVTQGLYRMQAAVADVKVGSIDAIAKALPVFEQVLSSLNGTTPIFTQSTGGTSVNVTTQIANVPQGMAQFVPESPQARLLDAFTLREGEDQDALMRRVAGLVEDMHQDFTRLGYYRDKDEGEETGRQRLLAQRLGLPVPIDAVVA